MDLIELWKWAQENPLIMLAVAGAILFGKNLLNLPVGEWFKKGKSLLDARKAIPGAMWQDADTVTAYLYLCRRFEGDEKATAALRELFGCFAPTPSGILPDKSLRSDIPPEKKK